MRILLVVALSMAVSNCASVRVVKSKPGRGGVLAIKEGLFGEPAGDIADKTMQRNCRRGYRVVEEGEHVIGSRTKTSGREKQKGSLLASSSEKSMHSDSETMDKTEWRIKYRCKRSRR